MAALRQRNIPKALLSLRYLDPLLKPIHRRCYQRLDLSLSKHILTRGALSGHLSTLFWECMRNKPGLLVEIGVRGGQSTAVFCNAAQNYDGAVISVDIEDTDFYTDYPRWSFFKERSQDLAGRFQDVKSNLALSDIDVLFLDSSHLYDETREELTAWLPHVAPGGLIICHDTAMGRIYRHADGTLRRGWNNHRGVTRALEEVLDISLDERRNFVGIQNGWVVRHSPLSSGLTMLARAQTPTSGTR